MGSYIKLNGHNYILILLVAIYRQCICKCKNHTGDDHAHDTNKMEETPSSQIHQEHNDKRHADQETPY